MAYGQQLSGARVQSLFECVCVCAIVGVSGEAEWRTRVSNTCPLRITQCHSLQRPSFTTGVGPYDFRSSQARKRQGQDMTGKGGVGKARVGLDRQRRGWQAKVIDAETLTQKNTMKLLDWSICLYAYANPYAFSWDHVNVCCLGVHLWVYIKVTEIILTFFCLNDHTHTRELCILKLMIFWA